MSYGKKKITFKATKLMTREECDLLTEGIDARRKFLLTNISIREIPSDIFKEVTIRIVMETLSEEEIEKLKNKEGVRMSDEDKLDNILGYLKNMTSRQHIILGLLHKIEDEKLQEVALAEFINRVANKLNGVNNDPILTLDLLRKLDSKSKK